MDGATPEADPEAQQAPFDATDVEPRRLSDLGKTHQRRAVVRTAATIVIALAMIIGAFYALPLDHLGQLRSVVRFVALAVLLVAVFVWQLRRISTAVLPELRAVEALGIVIIAFLIGFAVVYLSMSHSDPASFSRPLDHTQALYFTITTFSTVGFGDITPKTDPARIVVSIQMLLDLVIIGAVVRMIFSAARSRMDTSNNG